MASLVNELQSLRQAQLEVTKENVALRAKLMNLANQSSPLAEEFTTPDRGDMASVSDKNLQSLGERQERFKECQDPKEFQTPTVPSTLSRMPWFSSSSRS